MPCARWRSPLLCANPREAFFYMPPSFPRLVSSHVMRLVSIILSSVPAPLRKHPTPSSPHHLCLGRRPASLIPRTACRPFVHEPPNHVSTTSSYPSKHRGNVSTVHIRWWTDSRLIQHFSSEPHPLYVECASDLRYRSQMRFVAFRGCVELVSLWHSHSPVL